MENNISLWDKLPTEIQDYIINIKKQNKERDYLEEKERLYNKYDKYFYMDDDYIHYHDNYIISVFNNIKYKIGYITEDRIAKCFLIEMAEEEKRLYLPLNRQSVQFIKCFVDNINIKFDSVAGASRVALQNKIKIYNIDFYNVLSSYVNNKFVKKINKYFSKYPLLEYGPNTDSE